MPGSHLIGEGDAMERGRTDEPDGTPVYAASLRPPGDSVRPAGEQLTDEQVAADAAPAGDDPVPPEAGEGRAGYDVDAVSGDAEVYRPD
jgi:hypothetical protein